MASGSGEGGLGSQRDFVGVQRVAWIKRKEAGVWLAAIRRSAAVADVVRR